MRRRDEECGGPMLDEAREGRVDLAFGGGSKLDELPTERLRRNFGAIEFQHGIGIVMVYEHRNNGSAGKNVV